MIIYHGIKKNKHIYSSSMLCFSNDSGVIKEIPIDEATAVRISLYLNGFDNRATSLAVERGNDEASEEDSDQ